MPTRSPFILIGDPFLCEEKRREILAALAKEYGPDLAITLRRAGDLPIPELLSEARTLPFLAPAQVLGLRDADRLTKGDLELLETYFQSPLPQTLFLFEAESLDRDHPLFERGKKSGQIFQLNPERGKLSGEFIRRKLNQAGKKISGDALSLLEEHVGESLVFLDSVLEELILRAGEKPVIDREAVEACEEKLAHFEGFDLLDAMTQKDLGKALERMEDLLETSGSDFPALVGLLHWQLRRLWEAKRWLREGTAEREVARRLRLYSGREPAFFASVRRFSEENLRKMLEGLFKLDRNFKTGRAEGRYEIESWLAQAIG